MKKISLLTSLLLTSTLSAFDIDMSFGTHDFMVSDIVDDTPKDGIVAGTSHTLGLNVGLIARHTTPSNIHFLAKIETFLDGDTDHLDPDHIPVWFAFLFDVDGTISNIDAYNTLKWYVLMDNKQNTVSCVEREIRQHLGLGYSFNRSDFSFALNGYMGFYYIEIDDDTPVARGYSRQDTDDGEASNLFEVKMAYKFSKNLQLLGYARQYSANMGMENLERNYELLVAYRGFDYLSEKSTLNFEVKHTEYNLERFFKNPPAIPILPFDNETLIQATLTLPLNY